MPQAHRTKSSKVKPMRLDLASQHDLRMKNLKLLKRRAVAQKEAEPEPAQKEAAPQVEAKPRRVKAKPVETPKRRTRHRAHIGGNFARVRLKGASRSLHEAGAFNPESARAHQQCTEPGHRTNVGGLGHEKGPSPAPLHSHGGKKGKKGKKK